VIDENDAAGFLGGKCRLECANDGDCDVANGCICQASAAFAAILMMLHRLFDFHWRGGSWPYDFPTLTSVKFVCFWQLQKVSLLTAVGVRTSGLSVFFRAF